jgi:hypothetical protein
LPKWRACVRAFKKRKEAREREIYLRSGVEKEFLRTLI